MAAFVLVAIAGMLLLDFSPLHAAASWTLTTTAALLAGLAAFALVAWRTSGHLDAITRQFNSRTLVLMPIAMALDVGFGQAMIVALRLPLFLDSIGTVLVAVLAGPLAGALTGLLTALAWSFVVPEPFRNPYAAPLVMVPVVVGLLAGRFARGGFLRPRPAWPRRELAPGALIAVAVAGICATLAVVGYGARLGSFGITPTSDTPAIVALGWVALLLVTGAVVGSLALLLLRRDLSVALVVVAGAVTGLAAAVVSAPISANLFRGATGSGPDLVLTTLRQGGTDLATAVTGGGFLSDPLDKIVTFTIVYLLLGALGIRTKARFPHGWELIADSDQLDPTGSALRAGR